MCPALIIPAMQTISTTAQLERLKSSSVVLALFGGPNCGVCQAIKPKLETLMHQRVPQVALAYIDCEYSPDICGQHSVFSLPAVKLYIEGKPYLEQARCFSLNELTDEIERIYRLWEAH